MRVILMRHGQAAAASNDALRPLSEHGNKEVCSVATQIAELDQRIDLLVSSPLLRAKQTANAVETALDYSCERQVSNFLLPSSEIEFWVRELSLTDKNVMLVGHLPYMGILAGELLKHAPIGFNTADAILLHKIETGYQLETHFSFRDETNS